tara:strand:+ start:16213 stop:17346 length:1134 start_codon:yes stop_codon:yes gene_type:complete
MKILNVVQSVDEKTGGGATERARQLSLHLSRIGHDVTLLTTNCILSSSSAKSLSNLKLVPLPCFNKRFYAPWPLICKVNKLIKESDVVHLFSHWVLINVIVYLLVKINKKPYVVSPLGALPIFGRSEFLKRIYNFVIGKKMIQNANYSIVATLNELQALKLYNVDKKNVIHIPNGINEDDYKIKNDNSFKARLGLDNHPYVLFIGRLNPIKGPDLILEAFCNIKDIHPNLHLAYIGPNEGMLDNLIKITREHAVTDRVHFCGYVSREDKARIIQSSQFLIIPSRQEAMSIVVLEAGICGKPVLITDQCGFDEIEHLGGGLVVSADIAGLSQGINNMLNQKENFLLMGTNLQKSVRQKYLWSIVADRHVTIFNTFNNS